MSITCMNVINNLNKAVDHTNFKLIDHMTRQDMQYELACIKPDVTYGYYYETLKNEWEEIINQFINQMEGCGMLSEWISLYKYIDPAKFAEYRKMVEAAAQSTSGEIFRGINLDDIVLDIVASSVMDPSDYSFKLDENAVKTIGGLSRLLVDHCSCQLVDIFKVFIRKYKRKYHLKFVGKSKDEVIEMLRDDYRKFKNIIRNISTSDFSFQPRDIIGSISDKLTGIYSFSVESELDRLIPDKLGSLKEFFIKVISKYYNNLHPIIWAQIFKNMTENVFVELPFTPDEIFSFISKYILLNSGPFMLKVLQMIQPALTDELKEKYNLKRLKYPLMKPKEVDLVLGRVVNGWDMYKIYDNISASVGHVCFVYHVKDPGNMFIIKIIKPLSIAQSCWEYSILHDVYGDDQSCEKDFINHILESNGRELNVMNEINNVTKGHEYYTDTYKNVFGVDINAEITTIQNIPGIIKPGTWFALSLTRAPGYPISKLLEPTVHPNLLTDNIYRAKLHRCLDLLVYKFFLNLVQNGFYHGDLHAGNIFFSYEIGAITLIDFGAVGHIDLFNNDPSIKKLLEIVIMSTYYNYDGILDEMTILLNSKCPGSEIDMQSQEYMDFRNELVGYKLENIRSADARSHDLDEYKKFLFSNERVAAERSGNLPEKMEPVTIIYPLPAIVRKEPERSIYSYLNIRPKVPEAIVEYRDALPQFPGTSDKIDEQSFASILQKIIEYYAKSGVNIAIKFSDFYEFQKAYLLLLGVLKRVNYDPERASIYIEKAIINPGNIGKALHLSTTKYVISVLNREKDQYKQIKKQLSKNK